MSLLTFFAGTAVGALTYRLTAPLLERKACFNPRQIDESQLDVKAEHPEIRMLLLGDTGSGDEHQHNVAQASAKTCEALGADLVLLLGDNFIQHGVSSVDDPQWRTKFEDVYPQNLPFYAILGNHDLAGNWRVQVDYTERSERWRMPNVNYTLQAGPATIQCINTTCTVCALWTLFRTTSKPWRLVCGHRPLTTGGRHRGVTALERWLIRRAAPDFFLSGHNHMLEHLEWEGISQVVAGGGGSPLNHTSKQPNPHQQFLHLGHGYCWMRLTRTAATVRYFDEQGAEIYQFTRQK
jgi:acid phosphatase